jgi:hypothetical protein
MPARPTCTVFSILSIVGEASPASRVGTKMCESSEDGCRHRLILTDVNTQWQRPFSSKPTPIGATLLLSSNSRANSHPLEWPSSGRTSVETWPSTRNIVCGGTKIMTTTGRIHRVAFLVVALLIFCAATGWSEGCERRVEVSWDLSMAWGKHTKTSSRPATPARPSATTHRPAGLGNTL